MNNNKIKILAILGMFLTILTSSFFTTNKNKKNLVMKNVVEPIKIESVTIEKAKEQPIEKPVEKIKKIVISAVGDCTLGKDVNASYINSYNEYFDNNGASYFFSKVKNIFEDDDLTIANLENAFTDSKEYAVKKWVYSGKPSYAKILKEADIEVVSLANNHTMDYLEKGLEDTKKALEDYGIEYAYKNIINYREIKGIKIAIVSIAWDTFDDIKQYLAEANNNSDLQIVCMHSGNNYDKNYIKKQEILAYFLVYNGADLVLGHHPHVLQGIEKYKGVYIAYSLGNFSYGGKRTLGSENDTMILQASFDYIGKKLINNEINIIPAYCSSSFPKNDYQPMIIEDDEEKERVKQKILSLSKNIN